jgi:hypothetical protein
MLYEDGKRRTSFRSRVAVELQAPKLFRPPQEHPVMTSRLARILASLALALTLVSSTALAEEAKVPVTAADHMAMAKSYQEKAKAWRAEAAYHKDMAAAYAKEHPDRKSGTRNQWTVDMEKHCKTIYKEADKLAGEAEWAAKFHEAHAKEMEGK